MNKYIYALVFVTILLLGLTAVSAENVTSDNHESSVQKVTVTTTHSSDIPVTKEVSSVTKDNDNNEETDVNSNISSGNIKKATSEVTQSTNKNKIVKNWTKGV